MDPDLKWALGFVVAILALVALVCAAGAVVNYQMQQSACHAYERETGRDTRFVRYTIIEWDCLTPAPDGNWIPTSQLREIVE